MTDEDPKLVERAKNGDLAAFEQLVEKYRQRFWRLAESLVPIVVGFGCLTVAWLCVAMGMRKHA